MKRKCETVCSHLLLLSLPRDILSLLASSYLDPVTRASFLLVCQETREAVSALRQQLYWYTYRRTLDICETMGPEERYKFFWGNQYAPSGVDLGCCHYVMCVIPVRLELCGDNDQDYVIYCDDTRQPGPYKKPEQWPLRKHMRVGDRSPPTDLRFFEDDADPSVAKEAPGYHLMFRYHPMTQQK